MGEDRGGRELQLQHVKCLTGLVIEVPGYIVASQSCEGNCGSGVVMDEPLVEVGKT